MKLERELQEEQERTEQRKSAGPNRKKGAAGPYIITALGCIAVVLLVAYLSLAARLEKEEAERKEEESQDIIPVGNLSGTYTQEEVDAMIAQAEENARAQEAERILGMRLSWQAAGRFGSIPSWTVFGRIIICRRIW